MNNFDEQYYLDLYPDVLHAVHQKVFKSGHDHFMKHGASEGRSFRYTEQVKESKDFYTWYFELMKPIKKPIIIEIGANDGQDTIKLASLKDSIVHCFEPEPRCKLEGMPNNVIINRCAVSNKKGTFEFNQSDSPGHNWTYSGSLLNPKNHLTTHKHVYFKNIVKVPVITLDQYCKENKIESIDFLYMDTQGAESLIFEGAKNILKKTRFIYTEYSNDEMYEGQKPLTELLKQLETFFVLDDWPIEPSNVLLQNLEYL